MRAGAEPVAVDLFDGDAVKTAVDGCEAVAAPRRPTCRRFEAWPARRAGRTHNRLRTDRHASCSSTPRCATGVDDVREGVDHVRLRRRRRRVDRRDRRRPTSRSSMLRPTLEGERHRRSSSPPMAARAVVLRFGSFYGATGNRGTDEALRLARWRESMVGGKPERLHVARSTPTTSPARQWRRSTHPPGIYNAVDDEPLDAARVPRRVHRRLRHPEAAADADVAGPADERIGRGRGDPVAAGEQPEAP